MRLHSSVGRASYRYRGWSWVRIPLEPQIFFWALLHNCEDLFLCYSQVSKLCYWNTTANLYYSYSYYSLIWCVYDKDHMSELQIKNRSESDPRSYSMRQFIWIKPRKNCKAPMGFKPMTSAIPVRCSTNWAMKPNRKQVKCEFNLYLLYEENGVECIW